MGKLCYKISFVKCVLIKLLLLVKREVIFLFFFKVIFKIYALYSDIFDKHMLVLLKRNEFSCLYMKNQRSLAMFLSLFSLLQVYVHYFRATTQSP